MKFRTFTSRTGTEILSTTVNGKNCITMFFNEQDKVWLSNGGQPVLNNDGYLILPYGHENGKDLYPHLFLKTTTTIFESF